MTYLLKSTRSLILASLLLVVLFGSPVSAAPTAIENINHPNAIPSQYIVVLHSAHTRSRASAPSAEAMATAMLTDEADLLLHSYNSALYGFAAVLSDETVHTLQNNPDVASIEADVMVHYEAEWGLDRSNQRNLPLDNNYTVAADGTGVHAYIIDTGIQLAHNEFTGRLGNGYDVITPGGNANDCQGHGSHVAGTVGGTNYGIAQNVTLHPVRVFSCSGGSATSIIIAGVDWVQNNHIKPAVANMSLGGGRSNASNTAVRNLVDAGVTVVVAAGNENTDACTKSPASEPTAITVGSTTASDYRSSFSNYGSCVDLFAPGSRIYSADYAATSGGVYLSGTSMASPHVAGAAALYLQANPNATPNEVANALVTNATANVIGDTAGSPNRLLYVGFINSGSSPATPVPPTPTPPPSTGGGGNCAAPAWANATIYNGGETVSHAGHQWQAKWWTRYEDPTTNNGSGKAWKDLGACSGGGGGEQPVPTNTPQPTATATPPPSATAIPIPPTATPPPADGGGTCDVPAWDATAAYTLGDQVSQNGIVWQAKWWTRDEDPTVYNGVGWPWEVLSDCVDSEMNISDMGIGEITISDSDVRPTQITLASNTGSTPHLLLALALLLIMGLTLITSLFIARR